MNLRVKEICKEKGLTMEQVAQSIGIARVNLTKAINGNPTLSTLENIANALGVDITELFSRKGAFTALIDSGGILHRFDSVEALEGFISELKTSSK
ncbi:MAG: helix-turn-helix transcriptional regulator [Mucinivorans sp.]